MSPSYRDTGRGTLPSGHEHDGCLQRGPCRRCGLVDPVSDARQGDVGWGGVGADSADAASKSWGLNAPVLDDA